jgi:hypothetical protein
MIKPDRVTSLGAPSRSERGRVTGTELRLYTILIASLALGILACTSEQSPTGSSDRGEGSAKSASALSPGIGQSKVTVCHKIAPGGFVRIRVAPTAVGAHLAHGDKIASANSTEGCIPIVISLTPVADGSVRDGRTIEDGVLDNSVVQVLNVPVFEDRGIIEFDISSLSGPIWEAKLKLSVYASNGPYPFTIGATAYQGDGVLAANDWNLGRLFTSFQYSGEPAVTLDVTAPLQALISSGATFAGFNFRFSVPSSIDLNGPFVAFNSREYEPAAVLEVTGQSGP